MERSYFRSVPHHSAGTRSLPTDRVDLGTQVAILRTFARLSGGRRPVRGEQIAEALKMGPDTVSLSNGFFVDSGWLKRAGPDQYVATAAAIAFDHRMDSNDSTTAVELLARTARSSWYWETLAHSVDPGSMSRYDALVLLATVGNTAEEHRPQLEILLQWLEFVGMISAEGDRIIGARDREGHAEDSGDVVLAFTTDLHLTRDDLAELSPDQIRALFDAIGAVASLMRRWQ